ncbi:tumor necrosis factor receptor superfamily member 5 isoform X4 [Synchiropus splendidus]|uniref:tumor necrosis factor receptor superfamily member 5 isoform X4 n=1 Tax=Synchiropus splendidus TaxID=270530 RepID=UPI00237E0164|nr:tumor necrosis factor receptor superfamily member 5 isoform X4 [Synchiropus splendidus]
MFRKLSESSGILKAEEELSTMRCSKEDQYLNQNGRCCEKCPAGTRLAKECTDRETTQCQECGDGRFTTTKNSMSKCLVCRRCYPSNHLRVLEECRPQTNRVCQCESRFYCASPDCDICRPVTSCPPGQGVKVPSTRTNDTVCAPCGQGTYSNTSDLSACRPHTRCEDVGRHLATAGTSREDAMCGDLKTCWSRRADDVPVDGPRQLVGRLPPNPPAGPPPLLLLLLEEKTQRHISKCSGPTRGHSSSGTVLLLREERSLPGELRGPARVDFR